MLEQEHTPLDVLPDSFNLDAVKFGDDERFDFSYFPSLKTDRLALREISLEDTEAMFHIFSDTKTMSYYELSPVPNVEKARELIGHLSNRYSQRRSIHWGITLIAGYDVMVGLCGFDDWDRHSNKAFLDYDLMQTHWYKGIMLEALQAALRFGFNEMGLNRVQIEAIHVNDASTALLDRLGFSQEGLLRQYGYWDGAYHDVYIYSLLCEEFQKAEWATPPEAELPGAPAYPAVD